MCTCQVKSYFSCRNELLLSSFVDNISAGFQESGKGAFLFSQSMYRCRKVKKQNFRSVYQSKHSFYLYSQLIDMPCHLKFMAKLTTYFYVLVLQYTTIVLVLLLLIFLYLIGLQFYCKYNVC